MTQPPRNPSQPDQSAGSEAFALLLHTLSSDPEEAGRCYNTLHAKLVVFFNMKGVSDPMSAADEVIDRAGRRISEGAPVTNVNYYCMGIARNVAKERLRQARREGSAFLMLAGNIDERINEEVERINNLLEPCFKQLSPEDQQLLRAYCEVLRGHARAEHRRRLADEMKISQKALQLRITRLRSKLWECVRGRSANL